MAVSRRGIFPNVYTPCLITITLLPAKTTSCEIHPISSPTNHRCSDADSEPSQDGREILQMNQF